MQGVVFSKEMDCKCIQIEKINGFSLLIYFPPRAHFWPILSQEKCWRKFEWPTPLWFCFGAGCNLIFMIICTNRFHLWPVGHCLTRIYYCKCLQIGIAINFLDLSSFLLFEAPRVLLRIENVSKLFFWLFPFFILSPPGSDPPEKHLCFISNLSPLVGGWVSAFWPLEDVCSLKKVDSFFFK